MRALISWLALAVAVTSFTAVPAWGQNACEKIASDWDVLERNLAQNEADMAEEVSAIRASVLATQNQTIYNKGNTLSSAAQRFKCAKVYVTPETGRYINSAKLCTAVQKLVNFIDRYYKEDAPDYVSECDQSMWQPATLD